MESSLVALGDRRTRLLGWDDNTSGWVVAGVGWQRFKSLRMGDGGEDEEEVTLDG